MSILPIYLDVSLLYDDNLFIIAINRSVFNYRDVRFNEFIRNFQLWKHTKDYNYCCQNCRKFASAIFIYMHTSELF